MNIVKGTCPSCKRFRMNVLIGGNNKVKCPRCGSVSEATKWVTL